PQTESLPRPAATIHLAFRNFSPAVNFLQSFTAWRISRRKPRGIGPTGSPNCRRQISAWFHHEGTPGRHRPDRKTHRIPPAPAPPAHPRIHPSKTAHTMNSGDREKLLKEILPREDLADFRQTSLEHSLSRLRQQ